jgi:hypothetical protein
MSATNRRTEDLIAGASAFRCFSVSTAEWEGVDYEDGGDGDDDDDSVGGIKASSSDLGM